MKTDLVLVLNAGSTNLKFGVYALRAADRPQEYLRGQIEQHADRIEVHPHDGTPAETWSENDEPLSLRLLEWVRQRFPEASIRAVGHRVVHGGTRFTAPVILNSEIVQALEEWIPFAPLHQPHNLAPIQEIARTHPHLLQVACFDTAFHATQTRLARLYALPRAWYDEGIRRYGFHGLSYQYVCESLARHRAAPLSGPCVIAHLGGGASLCGIVDGVSASSTMGMTALDGLPMSTRCGAIDPGIALYLLSAKGMSCKEMEHIFYTESGLKGLSGISGDIRTLIASQEPCAQEAVEVFVRRAAREIAAIATEIGGLDTLVFTGGIGEHNAVVRARIVQGLAWLGLGLDTDRNPHVRGRAPSRIDAKGTRAQIWVVPTDEESVIALETAQRWAAHAGAL